VRGCSAPNSGRDSSETPASPGPKKTGGHSALQFDPDSATSFLFSTNNPATGNRWTTRIVRDSGAKPAESAKPEDGWRIALAPEGQTLGDDRANGNWILHLLETVSTAQFTEVPFSGTLESFGLTQPRVQLRWSVATSAGEQAYELRIGAPAQDLDGTVEGFSAQITESPNETPEIARTVYVVKGAILQMLEMVSSFNSLRLPTLTTFTADSVDALEISTDERVLLKARRADDAWKTLPATKRKPMRLAPSPSSSVISESSASSIIRPNA
jgi:hypothetical protein